MKTYLNIVVTLAISASVLEAKAQLYEQVLSCDNGAAVVDVYKPERENVQLVIRDRNIVEYLYGKGIYDRSLASLNCRLENNKLKCDPPTEIIIQGRNRIERGSQSDPGNLPGYPFYKGVFNSNDFASVDAGNGLGSRPTLRFFRDGRGLKIAGYGFVQGHCQGTISPSTGGCNGRVIPGFEYEIANWYFQNCQ